MAFNNAGKDAAAKLWPGDGGGNGNGNEFAPILWNYFFEDRTPPSNIFSVKWVPWEFTPTPEQQAIITHFTSASNEQNKPRHLMIRALAGSGKTTMLQRLLWEWRKGYQSRPYERKCLYLAFGRELADEARLKFSQWPGRNFVATSHQYGLAVIRWHEEYDRKLEVSTTDKRARDVAHTCGFTDRFQKDQLAKIARWWRSGMLDPHMYWPLYTHRDKWIAHVAEAAALVNDPVISAGWLRELIANQKVKKGLTAISALTQFKDMILNRQPGDIVDFDDMLILPEKANLGLKPHDLVLLDELQDWNPAQVEMLSRIAATGVQIIAVGDPNQSIFAFRSGPYNAMEEARKVLEQHGGLHTLPMRTSQRCAQAVAELAARIVPDFVAKSEAPRGYCGVDEFFVSPEALWTYHTTRIKSRSPFILARTNFILMPYALYFWRNRIPFHYKFDLSSRLRTIIGKFVDILVIEDQITLWEQSMQRRGDLSNRQQAYIQDCAGCLRDLAKEVPDPEKTAAGKSPTWQVMQNRRLRFAQFNQLFDSICGVLRGEAEVVLSTVHGAKGLEADTVYIVGSEMFPHWLARRDHERAQEDNLMYVGLTRARMNLFLDGMPVPLRVGKDEKA